MAKANVGETFLRSGKCSSSGDGGGDTTEGEPPPKSRGGDDKELGGDIGGTASSSSQEIAGKGISGKMASLTNDAIGYRGDHGQSITNRDDNAPRRERQDAAINVVTLGVGVPTTLVGLVTMTSKSSRLGTAGTIIGAVGTVVGFSLDHAKEGMKDNSCNNCKKTY